ncbi:MAG TPA: hypothetical protein VMX94_07190 [Armatimonadota bacterium]|nr:hypothetical protein [Armatimonadota bacterium]
MSVDYNFIVIGLISVLVCLVVADHAVVEFKGQINNGGELTFFLGTATVDHTGGNSIEINYRHRDSQESWQFKVEKSGAGEITHAGTTSPVEVTADSFKRIEVADLAGALNTALGLPEPGLEMQEDTLVNSGGRPAMYHFSFQGERLLTLLRYTDPRGYGAPRDATLNLEGVKVSIKFGSIDVGEEK